ncbi:MAG: hypothetical protein K5666_00225 [Bacilli bacterium]|nr:hypothetical protein [Bacilli bacterium]
MDKSSLLDDMNSSLVFKLRELKDFDTKIQRNIVTLEKTHPRLLFGLIYDNPLFEEIALRLFNSVVDVTNLYPRHIYGMYTCTKYGKKLIKDKYELFFN